ncbi:MAG: chromosomal replication initiator protein DnaA [Actinomycetota bacterium]|nr:chromosomal replication initiator protein DnaA [Actinomycetota bacterium]
MQPNGAANGGSASAVAPSPTAQELWARSAPALRSRLSEVNFGAWFAHARPVSLEGDTFVLGLPSTFVRDWVEGRYLDDLGTVLSQIVERPVSIALVTDETLTEGIADPPPDIVIDERPEARPPDENNPSEISRFHPKYTFDSFVIGSSNRFAHAAAQAVSEAPGAPYNPLFIYGEAGLGKTHLLHAIGRYVTDCHRDFVVRYVSTEQFMNEFIAALQRRTIPQFHRRYRVADILLIDDIQFLEGKERTQEEFFHTFNALHPRSQIVITSDRPPKKIATLEERLRTRFEWGLITDIQPPDLETRLAILRKKTETDRLRVTDEVMNYIASRIQTNIRELEGALIRVTAYASLTRSEVTLELAQNVLQSLLPNLNEARRVTSDLIISVAAEYFDVTAEEICSASRSRPLVNARQVAMYLCRELTDLSLPKIGERFGGRDHSTVIFAVNKVREHMQEQENWFEQVRELTTRVRQQAARL